MEFGFNHTRCFTLPFVLLFLLTSHRLILLGVDAASVMVASWQLCCASNPVVDNFHSVYASLLSWIQCFDTVGWALGRASGL